MTLKRQTKLTLNSDKFEQLSGDTLNLSGDTNIYGKLAIIEGAAAGRVLTSDSEGVGTWTDSNAITGATNGLTSEDNIVKLGGNLIENTTINADTNNFIINNASQFSAGGTLVLLAASNGVTLTRLGGINPSCIGITEQYICVYSNDFLCLSGQSTVVSASADISIQNSIGDNPTKKLVFNTTNVRFIDSGNTQGILYADDYSSTFVDRSLVDKGYVDSAISGSITDTITGATNIGGGSGIYSSTSAQSLNLRSLIGSGETSVSVVGDEIRIFTEVPEFGDGEAIRKEITQVSHGFAVQDVVGFSGGTYNQAIADGSYDGEVLGLVTSVIDADTFELTQAGYVTGLSGLVQNTTYFLSHDTEGLLVDEKPITDGHIAKTVLVADSTTSGWVLPYPGYVVTTGDTPTIIIDPQLDLESGNPVANSAVTTAIYTLVEPPEYIAPTANLTAGIHQTVEMGTTLTNFTANISFNQNDAGSANAFELRRNTVPISTSQNNTLTESNITTTLTFQGTVSYDEGPTKDNILDVPDPRGKIEAGSVNTPNRTITPRLRQWWGSVAAVPTNSAEVRALPNTNFANTNVFDLVTGTVNNLFVFAIPATKSLVSVIDLGNLNADITSLYVLEDDDFTVLDAGDNNRTYKLYVMETAVPYSTSTTHRITVS